MPRVRITAAQFTAIIRPDVLVFVLVVATLFAAVGLHGCGTIQFPIVAVPDSCDEVTALFPAEAVLDQPDHECHDWVEDVYGRVALTSNASAVVWTRRTAAGTAIIASAAHALGVDWFGPPDVDIAAALSDPAQHPSSLRVRLVATDGSGLDDQVTPLFELYSPEIPSEQNVNMLVEIHPRHDFYLAVIDSQKLPDSAVDLAPEPLTDAPPMLYDPAGLTDAEPSYAALAGGEIVLLVGYPGDGALPRRLAVGVGRVVADEEAAAIIARLGGAGDVEGDLPYDAEAEMIIEGEAAPGMSGGGAFAADGRLAGIIVRGSDPLDGKRYARAVRMSYVAAKLDEAFDALGPQEQADVAPYLPEAEALPRVRRDRPEEPRLYSDH